MTSRPNEQSSEALTISRCGLWGFWKRQGTSEYSLGCLISGNRPFRGSKYRLQIQHGICIRKTGKCCTFYKQRKQHGVCHTFALKWFRVRLSTFSKQGECKYQCMAGYPSNPRTHIRVDQCMLGLVFTPFFLGLAVLLGKTGIARELIHIFLNPLNISFW